MSQTAKGGVRSAALSAVIIRADGRVEQLGVISSWHRNPFVRAWWRVRNFFA